MKTKKKKPSGRPSNPVRYTFNFDLFSGYKPCRKRKKTTRK